MSSLTGPARRPPLDAGGRVGLMRDGMFHYAGNLVSRAMGIVLVPVMLKGLGPEAYGLWIAAFALPAAAGALDVGMGMSLMREVAARRPDDGDRTARLVEAAGGFYLALGIAGALSVGLLGFPLSGGLRLSAPCRDIAPVVFIFAGISFLGDEIVSYAAAVLGGLRRFDAIAGISIFSTLLRAGGIIALLRQGAAVQLVAMWQAAASILAAWAALGLLRRLEPGCRFGAGKLDWEALRAHAGFGASSQLTALASGLTWQAGPVLIGLVNGPAAVAPYHIGQRFPMAASSVHTCAGDAFFPAVSEYHRTDDMASTQAVLDVSTRWIAVLMFPLCLALWMIAPDLLRAWLGQDRPDAALIMRLASLAVLVDSLGTGAMQLLWGRGAAGTIAKVASAGAALNIGSSLWLLPRVGIAGAAWGLLLSQSFCSSSLLFLGARMCRVRLSGLIRSISRGLLAPTLLCAAGVLAAGRLVEPGHWAGVAAAALAGATAYAAGLYTLSPRAEERMIALEALRAPRALAHRIFRLIGALP